MAINKTKSVQRIEVYPPQDATAADNLNAKHESVMVVYNNVFTGTGSDASDSALPSSATNTVHLFKYVADEGAATDYSAEDALVKTICDAIWK